jgi:hypothetical protein
VVRARKVLLVVSALLAPAIVTLAFAQPRGGAKPPAKPPKPPAAIADAAPAATADEASAPGAPLAIDAAVAAPIDLPDGATKPSPLNPAPNETPSGAALDAGAPTDYEKLLADIAALRARVAAVGDALYKSRIAISVETDGDAMKISRLSVSIDDGVVFAPPSFSGSDAVLVYDHAVAPGRHAVTIEVERKDAKDDSFRTAQRSRFNVEVPRDHKLELRVTIADDSTMGADFPADRSGRYDARIRVKAAAKPVGR